MENYIDLHGIHTKIQRSLIPFIGKGLRFLFGTATEADLKVIHNNIDKLAKNQEEMALSKLCVIALFMKDEERIAKNCNSIIKPNSVLPTASHIIDGLWFVAAQQVVTFTVV